MKEFATKHKHHLILWIILLIVTTVSGYFAFFYEPTTTSLSTNTALPASPAGGPLPEPASPVGGGEKVERSETRGGGSTSSKVYTIVDFLTQPKQENEPAIIIVTNSLNTATNTLSATLKVNEQKYTLVYTNGDDLFTAMNQLQTNTDFRFSGRNFGGSLGYFIEEINGVKNDHSKGKYWVYSINGEKAKIGISNYIVKSNDIITWDYEKENK